MLKPGKAASKVFQIGDKVVTWNGAEMMVSEGGRMIQRKLADVTPDPLLDSYTVVVERSKSSWTCVDRVVLVVPD